MITLRNAITSPIFKWIIFIKNFFELNNWNSCCKNNGKMNYVNAYSDVIDDFTTINNFLEMALSSMIYIINDVVIAVIKYIFPFFIF